MHADAFVRPMTRLACVPLPWHCTVEQHIARPRRPSCAQPSLRLGQPAHLACAWQQGGNHGAAVLHVWPHAPCLQVQSTVAGLQRVHKASQTGKRRRGRSQGRGAAVLHVPSHAPRLQARGTSAGLKHIVSRTTGKALLTTQGSSRSCR
jgi:hypothetical protein